MAVPRPKWLGIPITLGRATTTAGPSGTSLPIETDPAMLEQEAALTKPSLEHFIFGAAALGASQSGLQLSRAFAGVSRQIPAVMPYRGAVVAIVIRATGNKTAGLATFALFKNGAAVSGATLRWANGTSEAVALFVRGTYGFVANDDLDVRVTTNASFAPTTLDVEAFMYAVKDLSSIV